jgi:hypothetical protein
LEVRSDADGLTGHCDVRFIWRKVSDAGGAALKN